MGRYPPLSAAEGKTYPSYEFGDSWGGRLPGSMGYIGIELEVKILQRGPHFGSGAPRGAGDLFRLIRFLRPTRSGSLSIGYRTISPYRYLQPDEPDERPNNPHRNAQ